MSQVSEEIDDDSKTDVNFSESADPSIGGSDLDLCTSFRQTKHKRQRNDEQQSEKGTQRVTAIHQIINSSSIFSAYCCGYGMPAEWLIDGPMTSTSDIIISNVIE